MPLYQNLDTEQVVELPEHLGEHPVLGARYVAYEAPEPTEDDLEPKSLWPEAKPVTPIEIPKPPAPSIQQGDSKDGK